MTEDNCKLKQVGESAPLLGNVSSGERSVSFGDNNTHIFDNTTVSTHNNGTRTHDEEDNKEDDDAPHMISSSMSNKRTPAQQYARLKTSTMSPMEAFEQSFRGPPPDCVGDSMFDDMSKSKRCQMGAAVLLLRDALLGTNEAEYDGGDTHTDDEFFNSYEHNDLVHRFSLFSRRMLGQQQFAALVKMSLWALVALTFFEPPLWCLEGEECRRLFSLRGDPAFVSDQDLFTTNVEYYPNFHSLLLTTFQAQMMELLCLVPVTIHVIFEFGMGGMSIRRYLRRASRTAAICRITRSIALLGLILGNLIGGAFAWHRLVTVNQYWRIVLCVCFSKDIIRELRTVIKLIPEVVHTFILFTIVLAFYAWIGTVAFYETDEGRQHFGNIVESMWTLWTCVTTANYPDVMMTAYNENRLVNIYFVSFMVIQFYGFMNVILAVVVNFYSGENDEYDEAKQRRNDEKLTRAFQVLDTNGDGVIGQETVMKLFPLLNQDCPDIK
jgi:hypothetical protein